MDERNYGVCMELIIGGCFQGKLDYAKQRCKEAGICVREEEILDGGKMPAEEYRERTGAPVRILNHLHLVVRQYVETGKEFYPLQEALQDTYLAFSMEEAAAGGDAVYTKRQIWAP